ncbi:MAG: ATP-binding cassette domain-containing protein, partial [Burkholderiaceae bacterium]|nr:ATP-binding cassette domain-containing protein [Burkholderiaceae bacterium]
MKLKFEIPKTEIWQAVQEFKGELLTVMFFTATINLLMLVPSLYMLQVYDRVLGSRNDITLLMLTLMMLGAYAFMAGLEYARSFIMIRLSARLDMKLNKRIYTAAFERSLKNGGTNAGQALTDLTSLRQFVTGSTLFAFFDLPWFPIYLAVIFAFDSSLGWFSVVGTLILVAIAVANEFVTRKPLADANTMAIASTTTATNNMRNAEVIESMGMLPNLMSRWFVRHSIFLKLQADASEKSGTLQAITKFVQVSQQSLVLGFGALLAVDGKISAGMMIAASILVGRALAPVQSLIGVWKSWSSARSAYSRLVTLLEENPARRVPMSLPKPEGNLTLETVTAAPPGVKLPVLKNLSLAIKSGDVVGVIGPSGAGKSTLARLLVGVWPALMGKVRLDGADIYQWNK